MKSKKLAAVALLSTLVLSLFGCSKRHIMDGPGMINDQPWKGFTLSRTDSYCQYNFWFTVQQSDFTYLLTGECRDADGEVYILEEGAELSAGDLQYLRGLWLGELPDVVPGEDEDELFILDAPSITFVLTWLDGTQQEKSLPSDVSHWDLWAFFTVFQKIIY